MCDVCQCICCWLCHYLVSLLMEKIRVHFMEVRVCIEKKQVSPLVRNKLKRHFGNALFASNANINLF